MQLPFHDTAIEKKRLRRHERRPDSRLGTDRRFSSSDLGKLFQLTVQSGLSDTQQLRCHQFIAVQLLNRL